MKKIFSNREIFEIAQSLHTEFLEDEKLTLPVIVNFSLQKNIVAFTDAAKTIETTRQKIAKQYGEFSSSTGNYSVKPENIPAAQEALDQLFEIEQSVDVTMIELEDLEDIKLTTKQMHALMFMIDA